MAQEIQIPHTLNSAVEIIRVALEAASSVDKVSDLAAGQSAPGRPFVALHVAAHLADGARFTVRVEVS